jgi:hypothetical protein
MLKLFSVAAGKVDTTTGVISGVSVITAGVEAIGHGIYTDPTTLTQVKACADAMRGGVQVKMDHWSGFGAIVGVLKNFRVELAKENSMGDAIGQCDCLRGDLHLLKSHPAFDQICEMCSAMPESFGLSITFSGQSETIDEMEFARCTELYSVDLVDRPAANPNGLFSAAVDLNKIAEAQNANKKFMNPLTFISDVATARKTFAAIDEIINPQLAKAGVLQLDVAGTPTATSDCPLLARLTAFAGLITAPEGKQREAELIASNALIAGEADTAKKNLAVAIATIAGLQAETAKLSSENQSYKSAVQVITAEKAQMKVQVEAALSECARVDKVNLSQNVALSVKALAWNAQLDLCDTDKNPLPANASQLDRQAAAERIAFDAKLAAIGGAVNAAVARTQVSLAALPAPGAAAVAGAKPEVKGRARFSSGVVVKQ